MKILLLNGANMNMLGKRNVKFYGSDTLPELERKIADFAKTLGAEIICRHSNCEGELIDILQQSECDGAVFNAGAYSHYSYALRDCIECLPFPVVEVHMSNVNEREPFRRNDVLKDVCKTVCLGAGIKSYFDAVTYLTKNIK